MPKNCTCESTSIGVPIVMCVFPSGAIVYVPCSEILEFLGTVSHACT